MLNSDRWRANPLEHVRICLVDHRVFIPIKPKAFSEGTTQVAFRDFDMIQQPVNERASIGELSS